MHLRIDKKEYLLFLFVFKAKLITYATFRERHVFYLVEEMLRDHGSANTILGIYKEGLNETKEA